MDTQNQPNPWISERSLGSAGIALQYAEESGVIRKVLVINHCQTADTLRYTPVVSWAPYDYAVARIRLNVIPGSASEILLRMVGQVLYNDGLSINPISNYNNPIPLNSHMLSVPVWGYATAADKQRLDTFIRHAVHTGLYPADGPNLPQLVSDGDEALFARILANQQSTSCTTTTISER